MVDFEGLRSATWRKSTRSAGSEHCISLACDAGWCGIRDSKRATGFLIGISPETLAELFLAIKAGILDSTRQDNILSIRVMEDQP